MKRMLLSSTIQATTRSNFSFCCKAAQNVNASYSRKYSTWMMVGIKNQSFQKTIPAPSIINSFSRHSDHPRFSSHTINVSKTSSTVSEYSTSQINNDENDKGPKGDLFKAEIGPDLVNKYASINRIFGPNCNAQAMLTCGGKELAKHASFDPQYSRAKDWIRSHPVGPAVISPLLISGLLTALIEAAMPQSIPLSTSMEMVRPLIVGVSFGRSIKYVDYMLQ